jgi:catechol 2,3-dioxygenase-like lactoylglutathione lyase family enzyme
MQVKRLLTSMILTLILPFASQAAGIPGMRGADHVGITVANLDEAVIFFVDVLGCEAIFSHAGVKFDDDWAQVNLNVNPHAEIHGYEMLRCGHGSNVEVFEYASSDQVKSPPKNSDIGGHHLAFYVDDMDKAVAYLRAQRSVRVLGEPHITLEGRGAPDAGQEWIYFIAPWGMQMELVSYPKGRAYEKTSKDKLWDPRDPAK